MKNLSVERMVYLTGGKNITRTQYCSTLAWIMNNNDITIDGLTAWDTHSASKYCRFNYY
jgi:hypothetical protein